MIHNRIPGETWIDHAGNRCVVRENGTIAVKTLNDEPSMAIQSEKDSCDLNLIIARFLRTGTMGNIRSEPLQYGDFSNVSDYHTAVARAQEAEEAFMTLPAQIRARFDNDPGKLIDFLGSEENRAEAIKLGLVASPQDSEIPQGDDTPPADGDSTPPAGEDNKTV